MVLVFVSHKTPCKRQFIVLSDFSFPDIYMDRKPRFPPVSDRMSSLKLQLSKLSVVRYWPVELILRLLHLWPHLSVECGPGGHRQRKGVAEAET